MIRSLFAVLVLGVGGALAQPPAGAPEAEGTPAVTSQAGADIALESYLTRLGLKELLADQLIVHLKRAEEAEKRPIAERLGKIYVEMLSADTSPQVRAAWEERSRELLHLVPEAESFELRLNLARVLYTKAEDAAESGRIRRATPAELEEAERILRTGRAEFGDLATKLNRKVENLEKAEEAGKGSEAMANELADSRRLRSIAFYYAGWCDYYTALLTNSDKPAIDAMKSFGWLLNSRGGVSASVERLPVGLLKYEHIARAALGCAMCAGLRGNDTEAVRWLEAVENAPDLPPAIKAQLTSRRIIILASAKRWADLERAIRVARKADRSGAGPNIQPLTPLEARLLAILTLDAGKSASREMIEKLTTIALGDLVVRGATGDLLDIVRLFGTAPIGDSGFIVNFVRGIQAYERARESLLQKVPVSETDEPAKDPAIAAQFAEAAALLKASLAQPDADKFDQERVRAATMTGLALYFANQLDAAAEVFLKAFADASDAEHKEEALWRAVLALDHAALSGSAEVTKKRDQTAALYVRTFSGSKRAAELLVRRGSAGFVSHEDAAAILLAVPRDAPMYAGARRQAAQALFALYRAAPAGAEREFAATRFAPVAEESLQIDRRIALEHSDAQGKEAAARVLALARQLLEALTSGAVVDVPRAAAVLGTLEAVASAHALDLAPVEAELDFRKLQIALASDDQSAAGALATKLRARGGTYADAADRVLYRLALKAWRAGDAGAAREVVDSAARIIARTGSDAKALVDPAIMTLHATAAEAALAIFTANKDVSARDAAIKLDKAILAVSPRNEASLRRLAATSEAAGDFATMADCWSVLLTAVETGTPPWFEARYQSIRALVAVDKAKAAAALAKHVALYPEYGPEPWGSKLKQLHQDLGGSPK